MQTYGNVVVRETFLLVTFYEYKGRCLLQ